MYREKRWLIIYTITIAITVTAAITLIVTNPTLSSTPDGGSPEEVKQVTEGEGEEEDTRTRLV